jgi:hypothetical protein
MLEYGSEPPFEPNPWHAALEAQLALERAGIQKDEIIRGLKLSCDPIWVEGFRQYIQHGYHFQCDIAAYRVHPDWLQTDLASINEWRERTGQQLPPAVEEELLRYVNVA